MKWKFETFTGDGAIYCICPKCNFYNGVTKGFPGGTIDFQYNYCPMCGEFLYDNSDEIEVIWNERSILDFWNEEEKK